MKSGVQGDDFEDIFRWIKGAREGGGDSSRLISVLVEEYPVKELTY
jgi:hypothetical protein